MGHVNVPGSIETVTGKFVSPLHCTMDDIDIVDIAWALSRISRFAGHTITEVPYNVAQHSLFVCEMIEREHPDDKLLQFYGLMHDAAEAYIGDIPSPIKHLDGLGTIFKEMEDGLLNVIFSKFIPSFSFSDPSRKVVDFYDKRALYIEAHAFMESRGRDWCDHGKYEITLVDLQDFPAPVASKHAYHQFMSKFNELIESLQ